MSTMRVNVKTTGLDGISKNLNSYLNNLKSAVFDACGDAAAMVRKYANITAGLTPVDTGYMVSSSFDINILVNGNPGAEIVYTAPYSMYVEDPAQTLNHSHGKYYNMKHAADIAAGLDHARKPEETNLFLSIAVYDNRQNVFEIIKGAAVNVTV